ncbi:MAG: CopG family transcriptional regulator [Candidatus Heimdallarchaeota archaeon]|nr:CopG family transcriptional regulator [Candidatus Heimdallarchaeota archaeon]MCK4253173.1 CopG family transcriptional regulator [Candidatus Heimdallarchaeota archaeon]
MTEKQYEKITVNLPAVDLGKIDYLVEQGFYNTRTEFIRTSIKGEIDKNSFAINKVIQEEEGKEGTFFAIGVISLNKSDLERYAKQNKKIALFVMGMCFIGKNVTVELASKTIKSFRVYGIKKGPKEVLEYLSNLGRER